jgi:ATP synthase protein I
MRELLPYTNLGWQLVASILIFFGAGYGLDSLLGTGSILTIILSVLGIVYGLWSVIKSANELQQKSDSKKS